MEKCLKLSNFSMHRRLTSSTVDVGRSSVRVQLAPLAAFATLSRWFTLPIAQLIRPISMAIPCFLPRPTSQACGRYLLCLCLRMVSLSVQ